MAVPRSAMLTQPQDNMVDDPAGPACSHDKKIEYLAAIKAHLIKSYEPSTSPAALNAVLDMLDLSPEDRTVFHAFSRLVPRLVPIHPFLELCRGYETDLRFANRLSTDGHGDKHASLSSGQLWKCLPIITHADLLAYADDVAGSVASACCYLAWSILTPSKLHPTRPVLEYTWAEREHEHGTGTGKITLDRDTDTEITPVQDQRIHIIRNAREMGWALQLVNVARDVKKDALNNRIYMPLSSFPSSEAVFAFLRPAASAGSKAKPAPLSCQPQVLGLVDIASSLRQKTAPYMDLLPREARGGLRAMVASYFEIAEEITRRDGLVDERGVKVSSWRRARAAAAAMWGIA